MCAANGRIMQQEGGNPTDILDNLGKGGGRVCLFFLDDM